MKKPLIVSKLAEKKKILIPLALVPAGVASLFLSNKTEQPPQISQPEPPAQMQVITPIVQSSKHPVNLQPSNWAVDNYDDNDTLRSSFSLEIKQVSSENIEGEYCYISNYGKKDDCFNKFSGSSLNNNDKSSSSVQYLVKFNSSFKNLAGKATLELSDTEVVWDLKEFPSDQGVGIPKHAILTKENKQLTRY